MQVSISHLKMGKKTPSGLKKIFGPLDPKGLIYINKKVLALINQNIIKI